MTQPKRKSIQVDALGRVVSIRLSSQFETRKRLLDFADRLESMRLEWADMAGKYSVIQAMPFREICECFAFLVKELKETMPATPCPSCSPTKSCPNCKNKRWLSEREIQHLLNTVQKFTLRDPWKRQGLAFIKAPHSAESQSESTKPVSCSSGEINVLNGSQI